MAEGLTTQEKQELIGEFRINDEDTGSADVQIAILSKRIDRLTRHVQEHKKDHHTRRGLMKLVAKRNRLLDYLKREDYDRFKSVVERLGIRRR